MICGLEKIYNFKKYEYFYVKNIKRYSCGNRKAIYGLRRIELLSRYFKKYIFQNQIHFSKSSQKVNNLNIETWFRPERMAR